MTIRIFNPDHDLALASNQIRFTAPHAGRQLRSDLGYIPALWADEGDVVVVEDIDMAASVYHKLKYVNKPRVEFATYIQLADILKKEAETDVSFDVWGWNKTLRQQLLNAGVGEDLLPNLQDLEAIRNLSSRVCTTEILKALRSGIEDDTCGESIYCTSAEEISALMVQNPMYGQCVVKAPWSSSGRGVKYLFSTDDEKHLLNTWNWIRNTIRQQGGVTVEPYYNKVKDFGMEFSADGKGGVEYCGLSLFTTVNGAYTSNLLATEEEKREMISKYISLELIDETISRVCKCVTTAPYCGVFGVDMMIVAKPDRGETAKDGFLLHPCVEINMRRTMGHVALAISPKQPQQQHQMSISYSGNKYHFNIKPTMPQ